MARPPPKAILIWLPGGVHKELTELADSQGASVAALVRGAVRSLLKSPDAVEWRELPLRGGPGLEIDQQLTWILARHPAPSDWLGVGGELDKRVAAQLRRVLKGQVQAQKRVARWLQGKGYEQQAADEGVSRQAIHICVKGALARLAADEEFCRVLREVVAPEPKESRVVVEDWYG
jgi:hypothetical protein